MQQPGPRGRSSSSGTARGQAGRASADDWLGDVSEYDWDEGAAEHAEHGRATPTREGLVAVVDAPRPSEPTEARRAAVERRRIVAGLLIALVLGVVIVIALLLLRGGNETSAPPATTPSPSQASTQQTSTQQTPTQQTPTQQTPTQQTQETPSTTTPATGASFTLPEGTKLRLGEGDPELVRELQQALVAAGYDPGSADGTFGPQTEAAVTAFQQDNGLAADGVVGAETAAALNSAISSG